MKQKLYLDMDGVIADFYNSPMLSGPKRGYGNYPEMYRAGFFYTLPPVEGALDALERILRMPHLDVWILTQPVKESAHSYSEKAMWVMKHIQPLSHKIIMTQNKTALARHGDVLVDDHAGKWQEGWESHGGVFIHFDEEKCPKWNWENVIQRLTRPIHIEVSSDHVNT
jgi:5'(3')-deoxyribonucleotidase